MDLHDFHSRDLPPKGRPDAAKVAGARRLVERCSWMEGILIYWAGKPSTVNSNNSFFFRSIDFIISDFLVKNPAGLYLIKLEFRNHFEGIDYKNRDEIVRCLINPEVVSCIRITSQKLSTTSLNLRLCRKYPKALGKVVENPETWMNTKRDELNKLRSMFDALNKPNLPNILCIEENCIWLGEGERFSDLLDADAVQKWVTESKEMYPGLKAAAFLLGNLKIALPETSIRKSLERWNRLGRRNPHLPVNILPLIEHQDTDSEFPKREHLIKTLREYWLAGGRNINAILYSNLPDSKQLQSVIEKELIRRSKLYYEIVWECSMEVPENILKRSDCSNDDILREWLISFRSLLLSRSGCLYSKGENSENEHENPLANRLFTLPEDLCVMCEIVSAAHQQNAGISDHLLEKVFDRVINTHFPRIEDPRGFQTLHQATVLLIARAAAFMPSSDVQILPDLFISWLNTGIQNVPQMWGEWVDLIHPIAIYENVFAFLKDNPEAFAWFTYKIAEDPSWLTGCYDDDIRVTATGFDRFDYISKNSYSVRDVLISGLSRYLFLYRSSPEYCKAGKGFHEPDLFEFSKEEIEEIAEIFSSFPRGVLPVIYDRLIEFPRKSRRAIARFYLNWCLPNDIPYQMVTYFLKRFQYLDWAEKFLIGNIWIAKEIFLSALEYGKTHYNKDQTEQEDFDTFASKYFREIFCDCLWIIYVWKSRYGSDRLNQLLKAVLEIFNQTKTFKIDESGDYYFYGSSYDFTNCINLFVLISKGQIEKFSQLFSRLLSTRDLPNLTEEALPQLEKQVSSSEHVGDLLYKAFLYTEFWQRLSGIVQNISYAIRCQSQKEITETFSTLNRVAAIDLPVEFESSFHSNESQNQLKRLIVLHRMIHGDKASLPRDVRKVLNLPASYEKERQHLKTKIKEKSATKAELNRLSKLEKNLEGDSLSDEINSRLMKLLPKKVVLAEIEFLEYSIRKILFDIAVKDHPSLKDYDHWVNDPDWLNAIALFKELRYNRKPIKELIERETYQDRDWLKELPENRKFSDRLHQKSYVGIVDWLDPFERNYLIENRKYRVYFEESPLRVMQMGNLFGTCLSREGGYNYSVVANAVEINKRVIYVADGENRIIGRKLLVLSDDGIIFGYCSYGHIPMKEPDSQWLMMKVLMDLFCMEFTVRIGAGMAFEKECDDYRDSVKLKLFLRWYDDGAEPFSKFLCERIIVHSLDEEDHPPVEIVHSSKNDILSWENMSKVQLLEKIKVI